MALDRLEDEPRDPLHVWLCGPAARHQERFTTGPPQSHRRFGAPGGEPAVDLTTYWFRHSAEPLAVTRGRQFVSRCLGDFRLGHLSEDAELIASELLTNSVKATGTCDPTPTASVRETLPLVAVRVRVSGPTALVDVWDTSTDLPQPGVPDDDAETGRGLSLVVAALSERWDAYLHPSGGKVVSAQLPIARPPVAHVEQRPGLERQVMSTADSMPRALSRRVRTVARAPLRMDADIPLLARLERLLEHRVLKLRGLELGM